MISHTYQVKYHSDSANLSGENVTTAKFSSDKKSCQKCVTEDYLFNSITAGPPTHKDGFVALGASIELFRYGLFPTLLNNDSD